MFTLPDLEDQTPLLRTDASRPDRWQELLDAIATPSPEGFRAYVHVIADAAVDGLDEAAVQRLPKAGYGPTFVFVVDARAMDGDEFPILVVDTSGERKPSFRVIASWLWAVENNLALANMGWEDFSESTGADGVFRGH